MTKHRISSLALKLTGIYCLFQSVPYLASAFSSLAALPTQIDARGRLLAIVIGFGLPVVLLGLCLMTIFTSNAIAARFFPEDTELPQSTSSLGFREIQVLGYHLIGLLLLVQSVPELGAVLLDIWRFRAHGEPALQGYRPDMRLPIVRVLFRFVPGMFLFLKPTRLADLLKANAAVREPTANDQGSPTPETDDQ